MNKENKFVLENLEAIHYTLTGLMETRAMTRAGLDEKEWIEYKDVTLRLQELLTTLEEITEEINRVSCTCLPTEPQGVDAICPVHGELSKAIGYDKSKLDKLTIKK